MYMTDCEIAVMYRQAKDPESQVQVLADLNGCQLVDMQKKLADLGLRGMDERSSHRIPPKEPSWAKIDYDAAKALFDRGATDAEAAQKLGCTPYAIRSWRCAHRVSKQKRPILRDLKGAMDQYLEGKTDSEIADAIGATKAEVLTWRKANGLPAAEKNPPAGTAEIPKKQKGDRFTRVPRWARINYDAAKNLYDQKLSDQEMAARLGCSAYAVERWRNAFNLPAVKTVLGEQFKDVALAKQEFLEQRGKLVLQGKLGPLPLKITVEIGV